MLITKIPKVVLAEKAPLAFDRHREICYNKSTKRGTADRRSVPKVSYKNSNRDPRPKGGYFFVWFMYAIKIDTIIPRIIRTTAYPVMAVPHRCILTETAVRHNTARRSFYITKIPFFINCIAVYKFFQNTLQKHLAHLSHFDPPTSIGF